MDIFPAKIALILSEKNILELFLFQQNILLNQSTNSKIIEALNSF